MEAGMKEINLSQVLVQKRREKGLTQDELAAYIGVSKASVSKWETGVSYPDITFLPLLASFFDISIDCLMNYSPQLSTPKMKEIYSRLAADFVEKPFEDVIAECELLVKKYYSCYPFLLEIVQLYINHIPMAANSERTAALARLAIGLCERVTDNSREVSLTKTAVKYQSLLHLMVDEAEKVLELMGEEIKNNLIPDSALISQAYQMLGNTEKAKTIVQTEIYQNLMLAFSGLTTYMGLNINNYETVKTTFERTRKFAELFNMRGLNPNNTAVMYLSGAYIEQAAGNNKEAVKMLEQYVDTCVNGFFPYKPCGDMFFDRIEPWLDESALNMPRNDTLIKENMLDILNDPRFENLREIPEFTGLINKMKNFINN